MKKHLPPFLFIFFYLSLLVFFFLHFLFFFLHVLVVQIIEFCGDIMVVLLSLKI